MIQLNKNNKIRSKLTNEEVLKIDLLNLKGTLRNYEESLRDKSLKINSLQYENNLLKANNKLLIEKLRYYQQQEEDANNLFSDDLPF